MKTSFIRTYGRLEANSFAFESITSSYHSVRQNFVPSFLWGSFARYGLDLFLSFLFTHPEVGVSW